MYKIKVTPNYYAGTCNAPKQHFLTFGELPEEHEDWDDNSYDVVECDSEQDAQSIIDEITDGMYYLSHGEASRANYEIINTDDGTGWGDDCVDSSGAYSGDWVEVDGGDLPDGAKEILDNLNVDYHSDGDDDAEIWTAETEIDDVEYAIAYVVKSIALQTYSDDLGCITWDKQSYYRKSC